MEQSRIWNFFKYLSFVVIAVLLVVLFAQFIQIAKLDRENKKLLLEQTSLSQNLANKQNKEEQLNNNYNSYANDKAKEEFNMKNKNEVVIIASK